MIRELNKDFEEINMELLETPIMLEFTITASNFQFVCIRQQTFSFLTYGIFTTNILQQFISVL